MCVCFVENILAYKFEIAAEELFSILFEKVPKVQIKLEVKGLLKLPIIILI